MSRHRSRTDHERASTIDSKSITSYNDWCEDPRAGQPTTHTYPRENHVIVRVFTKGQNQLLNFFVETRKRFTFCSGWNTHNARYSDDSKWRSWLWIEKLQPTWQEINQSCKRYFRSWKFRVNLFVIICFFGPVLLAAFWGTERFNPKHTRISCWIRR